MGVKGLQYYIEAKCPQAYYKVNIPKLAKEFSKDGLQPIVVVDGMSCLRRWYGTDLEWIYGGQWRDYVQNLKRFTENFKKAGIKLVFFFDGPTPDFKRSLWVQRRIQGGRDIEDIFRTVKRTHSKPTDPKLFIFPSSMGMLTRFILKYECHCVCYTAGVECDIEVAEYAAKNKCLGIMAQDSDYMIFDSAPFYFSSNSLNFESLDTINYDRDVFARSLNLQIDQLPLLASLVGNDSINANDLVHFHRKLCKDCKFIGKPRAEDVIPKVAHYMRNYSGSAYSLSSSALSSIAKAALGDSSKGNLIMDSILSYKLFKEPDGLRPEMPLGCVFPNAGIYGMPQYPGETRIQLLEMAQKRHIECEAMPYIFSVLNTLTWESSSALEDHVSEMASSALVYRPLRQKIYSLLLSGDPRFRNSTVLRVKEWCTYKGNTLEKPDIVEVGPIPDILAASVTTESPPVIISSTIR